MELKIIKTEEEYKKAVNYLEELGDNPDFENNTELIEKFELIEKLIEIYDKEHYPIEKGDPIEIIKLKMAYMNLKQKDLIQAIGSKGLVSDVLNKKRKLSKKMIRELSLLLNLSQEILNTEYDLSRTNCLEVNEVDPIKKGEIFIFIKAIKPQIDEYSKKVFLRRAIINVQPFL
jgi:HTH-type transcriptional regulator / antitoxin HigA